MAETTIRKIEIKTLPEGVSVKEAIMANVKLAEDGYQASAHSLGILADGYGDTPEDAVKDLSQILTDAFLELESLENPLGDVDKAIHDRLSQFMESVPESV